MNKTVLRKEAVEAFRDNIKARITANKTASAHCPRDADWTNGIARGLESALELFDGMVVKEGKHEDQDA